MLLADCGNSRCKLAPLADPTQVTAWAWEDPGLDGALAASEGLLLAAGAPARVEGLRRRWRGPAATLGRELPVPDCGQYPGLGLDRLLAGLAAVKAMGSDCLVVDAGTAITVDAWRLDRGRAAGARFDGGCIAPGPAAMLAGLHALAPALPALAPAADSPWPGHDTAGCLRAGCQAGLDGLIAGLVARLRESTGIATVFCCGGCYEQGFCTPPLGWQVRPALVLTGLAQAWRLATAA